MDKKDTVFEPGDEVWDILDKASKTSPKPMFVQDVVRSVRNLDEASPPWWKSLLSGAPAFSIAGVAAAAIAMVVYFNLPTKTDGVVDHSSDSKDIEAISNPENPSEVAQSVTDDLESISSAIASSDDDDLVTEYLVNLIENPDLLSEEDIASLFSL